MSGAGKKLSKTQRVGFLAESETEPNRTAVQHPDPLLTIKATARAKMLTSVLNRRLSLDQGRIMGFILQHIHGLIWIYNFCSIRDEKAWDLFYDLIFLDPVKTRHFSQFQLMWPHRRRKSSPFWELWAGFRSYIGPMFDKTRGQMSSWRWDNPRDFGDQVDRSNPQTIRLGKVERSGERFSWYRSEDLRAKIELPSCWLYKPGYFMAMRPLNWDEIIDQDDNDENWADPAVPSHRKSCPCNGNDNDNSEGEEEDTQGGEKGTGKGKGTKDGKENRMGNGNRRGNSKGKCIVKQPEGDMISLVPFLSSCRRYGMTQTRTWRAN
jgi:hypothetical protein